jgi:hypothetical protein
VSDGYAAMFHHVSDRTIYTWKKTLEGCAHVWLDLDFKSNRDPATRYNICALVPRPPVVRQDEDGCLQSGAGRGHNQFVRRTVDDKGRFEIGHEGQGARQPKQKHLPLPGTRTARPVEVYQGEVSEGGILFPAGFVRLKDRGAEQTSRSFLRGEEAKNEGSQGISADSRFLLRERAEEKIGSEPKKRSAQTRSEDRGRAEEKIGPEPKKRSGGSRSELRPSPEADCRQERQLPKTLTSLDNQGGEAPPDLEFEAWKKRYRNAFERELVPLHAELKNGLYAAAPEGKEWFQVRLDFLKSLRMGGRPPVSAKKSKPIVRASAPAPVEVLTGKELEYAQSFAKRLKVQVAA